MKEPRTIRSLFSQAGFVAEAKLHGVAGDRYARMIRLRRRKKQVYALSAGIVAEVGTTNRNIVPGIFLLEVGGYISSSSDGESTVLGAVPCM